MGTAWGFLVHVLCIYREYVYLGPGSSGEAFVEALFWDLHLLAASWRRPHGSHVCIYYVERMAWLGLAWLMAAERE